MRLPIKGYVVLKVLRNGKVIDRREGDNLVVQAGKNFIADLIFQDTSQTRFSHMALGSSGAAVLESQTALGTEITSPARQPITAALPGSSNEIQYGATFTNNSAGTITVAEAGIFNAATNGTMLARFLTQPVVLSVDDQLEITWTLTVG